MVIKVETELDVTYCDESNLATASSSVGNSTISLEVSSSPSTPKSLPLEAAIYNPADYGIDPKKVQQNLSGMGFKMADLRRRRFSLIEDFRKDLANIDQQVAEGDKLELLTPLPDSISRLMAH